MAAEVLGGLLSNEFVVVNTENALLRLWFGFRHLLFLCHIQWE
jgi:hypothetical protein